jgi:hypothetical protein
MMLLAKQLARAEADARHVRRQPALDPGELSLQARECDAIAMRGMT